MKLEDSVLPTTTTMRLVNLDGSDTDVYITGYTPDSSEWEAVVKDISGPAKSTSIEVGKKGKSRIEIPPDPNAAEKQRNLLIRVITNIEGFEGWEYAPEAATKLLSDRGRNWILDQWGEHLDDRRNFLAEREKPAKGTSKSARG